MFQLDAQVPQLVNSTPLHPEKGLCISPRAFGGWSGFSGDEPQSCVAFSADF